MATFQYDKQTVINRLIARRDKLELKLQAMNDGRQARIEDAVAAWAAEVKKWADEFDYGEYMSNGRSFTWPSLKTGDDSSTIYRLKNQVVNINRNLARLVLIKDVKGAIRISDRDDLWFNLVSDEDDK